MSGLEEVKFFESLGTLVSHAGPWGIAAYLLWRDLIQPRRNGGKNGDGKNGKHGNGSNPIVKDLDSLGQSFREFRTEVQLFRTEIWDRVTDVSDRLARIEGRLHGH